MVKKRDSLDLIFFIYSLEEELHFLLFSFEKFSEFKEEYFLKKIVFIFNIVQEKNIEKH